MTEQDEFGRAVQPSVDDESRLKEKLLLAKQRRRQRSSSEEQQQQSRRVIWCIAHSLWLGTTFTLVTSLGLIAHHLFAVWHGDRRLTKRYGDTFLKVKERTSVIPGLAIIDGRQKLALQEFLRPSYAGVTGFVFLFWWLHPWLMVATSRVNF